MHEGVGTLRGLVMQRWRRELLCMSGAKGVGVVVPGTYMMRHRGASPSWYLPPVKPRSSAQGETGSSTRSRGCHASIKGSLLRSYPRPGPSMPTIPSPSARRDRLCGASMLLCHVERNMPTCAAGGGHRSALQPPTRSYVNLRDRFAFLR